MEHWSLTYTEPLCCEEGMSLLLIFTIPLLHHSIIPLLHIL